MSDCDRFESILRESVGGGLDESTLGPLLAHCRACGSCRGLLELHRDLLALGRSVPEPDAATFDALSARVLRTVGAATSGPERDPVPAARRWRLQGRGLRVAAALAASVLLFVAGLAAGGALTGRAAPGGRGLAGRLITAIESDAASNHALADVEDSRYTYSNVSFRRLGDDRVALDFDVTTHVQTVEPVRSELVREVLVHSLLYPSTTGERLKAMSYAGDTDERKVREALILSLHRDENVAVRLEALSILGARLEMPDVQAAVLDTLRHDESVQVRLRALEYLAAHSIDTGRIRQAIEENPRPGDEALLVRLARYDKSSY